MKWLSENWMGLYLAVIVGLPWVAVVVTVAVLTRPRSRR